MSDTTYHGMTIKDLRIEILELEKKIAQETIRVKEMGPMGFLGMSMGILKIYYRQLSGLKKELEEQDK